MPGPEKPMVARDPLGLNTGAVFKPQLDDDTRPCITIAGSQVYAYVDDEGHLVVSIHTDEVELRFGQQGHSAPVRVVLDGRTVVEPWGPTTGCWCIVRRSDGTTVYLDATCVDHTPEL